jgi:hypothetical protein
MNQSHIERNDAERARLEGIVDRLRDEDLGLYVRDGWTVAGLLAHIAFWDRLRMAGWERQPGNPYREKWFSLDAEQDMINAAAQPALLAIPPREAALQAVAAAEAIDSTISNLDPGLAAEYMAGATEHERRMLDRSIHRRKHLDEIEEAIGGGF